MTFDRVFVLTLTYLLLIAVLGTPALIAFVRHHPDRRLIARLTTLTLFSFILWVALLIWAASDRRDDAVISKFVSQLRERKRFSLAVGLLVLVGAAGIAATLLS